MIPSPQQTFNYAAGFGYQAAIDFFNTIYNCRWEKFLAFLDRFGTKCVEVDYPQDHCDARSALAFATMHGRKEMVAELLRRGAEVDRRQPRQQTALHFAAYKRWADIAEVLAEHGADVNARTRELRTPLMLVIDESPLNSERSAADPARVLLSHGADPDLRDNFGRTAMMMAAEKGQTDVCLLLFNASADMDLRDPSGQTAIDCARKFGQEKTAAALEDAVRARDEAIQENAGVNLAAAATKGVAHSAAVMKKIRFAPR